MNISDLKKELQKYSLSTSTPGLTGDDRYEELKSRLELHLSSFDKGKKSLHRSQENTTNENIDNDNKLTIANFQSLTIGELRSRLSSLGVSTNTPGITGEDRWKELLKRYTNAISGHKEEEEEVEEESKEIEKEIKKPKEEYKKPSRPSVSYSIRLAFFPSFL